MGKGENAGNQHFLVFPQSFLNAVPLGVGVGLIFLHIWHIYHEIFKNHPL